MEHSIIAIFCLIYELLEQMQEIFMINPITIREIKNLNQD